MHSLSRYKEKQRFSRKKNQLCLQFHASCKLLLLTFDADCVVSRLLELRISSRYL